MRLASVPICLACTIGLAMPAFAADFPSDAQPVSADALKSRLSDKVFGAKMANGTVWRLEYKANGYLFVNAGPVSDSGKWRVEEGKVCADMQKSGSACSEFRILGEALLMKRASNGEIASLIAQ
jgi:hypothetical protein